MLYLILIDDDQANEVLLQQTFLMKSAALEIFNLLKNQLRGNAERLIQVSSYCIYKKNSLRDIYKNTIFKAID